LTLIRQSASAVSYLHGQTPPIVHRDIKPENILVESRSPFHIKLSDFGLAKAGSQLETHCGTPYYIAPEICQYSNGYTRAVDIWSLGVVGFQYGYGLPECVRSQLSWCEQIVKAMKMKDLKSDGLLDILLGMVVMAPEQRYSADECLNRARELERIQTPMPYDERQQREIGQSNPTTLNPAAVAFPTVRRIGSQSPDHPGSPGFVGDGRQRSSSRSTQDLEDQGYAEPKTPRQSSQPTFKNAEDSRANASNQVFASLEAPLPSFAPTTIGK
jgi:serine/threonine-protein kinase Chk2